MSGVTGPTGDRGVDGGSFSYTSKETVVKDIRSGVVSIYNLDGNAKELNNKQEQLALKDYIATVEGWFNKEKNSLTTEQQAEIEDIINTQKEVLKAKAEQLAKPGTGGAGTIEAEIALNYGAEFQQEVWSPMKEVANKALEYMLSNSGNLQGFSAKGIPLGVEGINIVLVENHSSGDNDRYDFFNGKGTITREADSRQARLTFTYGNTTFELYSDPSDLSIQYPKEPTVNPHPDRENKKPE